MKKKISLIILFMLVISIITSCASSTPAVNSENVWSVVDEYVTKISYKTKDLVKGEVPAGSNNSGPDIMYELPDIANYPLLVKGNGELDVEIFVPNENNGSSIADFAKYAAEKFNASNKVVDGKKVSVSIRILEPSLAEDYILSDAYTPEGYLASNKFCGALMNENGIKVAEVAEKMVGNTMGIAIQKGKYDELSKAYSEVTIKTIVDATKEGKLAVGYTNPTNNPTGLNFVVSMLSYFDEDNPMSFEATTDFSAFQSAVPLVSYSMQQMKDAVNQNRINAFVIEGQAFKADADMSKNYVYMPFGVRHDNPLYSVGNVSESEVAVLNEFANFVKGSDVQNYASGLGFNNDDNYTSTINKYDGALIKEVINVWKEARANAGNISVIFVADVSGSMGGEKIDTLKKSLLNSMQYINEETRVGIVSYASNVYLNLPLSEFNQTQKEYFAGAVTSLKADGGTATNNALLVAAKLLNAEPASNRKLIIVLSDGQTGSGYSTKAVTPILDLTEIPIYTIGYGKDADEKELTQIAQINNGLYNKADVDTVGYLMKTIFNAEA